VAAGVDGVLEVSEALEVELEVDDDAGVVLLEVDLLSVL